MQLPATVMETRADWSWIVVILCI